MSDVEDYMSDAFLTTINDSIPKVTRKSSPIKTPRLSGRQLENAVRSEGLEREISSDNKGYNLLVKMGYTPGKGLGKHESGRVDPVAIDLKIDKGGLGEKTERKERIQMKRKAEERIKVDYRMSKSKQFEEKTVQFNLNKLQRICRDLDLGRGLEAPVEGWYWPGGKEAKASYDAEIEEYFGLEGDANLSDEDKMRLINDYLRKMFHYCLWCGCNYEDEADLVAHCPGPLKDQHE